MDETQVALSVQTTKRKLRLEYYEREIEKRGSAFTAILRELRDDPLKPYLATHGSLSDYLQERWKMTARRQHQLMAAQSVREQVADEAPELADIAKNMKEGPLRELVTTPPEKRVAVLRTAVADKSGKLTNRVIKQAKARIIEPTIPNPMPSKVNAEPAVCPHCNGTGMTP